MRNLSEQCESDEGWNEALQIARNLAEESGKIVLRIRNEGNLQIERKSQEVSDIVTEADRASESHIAHSIHERYPSHGIRGEEGTLVHGDGATEWYIDGVDGTYNFSRGKPFGISIGMVRDRKSFLGALHYPDDASTLTAIVGQGAFRNGQSLTVNADIVPLSHAKIGFDVSSGGDELREQQAFAVPLQERGATVERQWCFTVGARRVLEGELDAYVCGGGLTPYDLAAAIVILRESHCFIDGLGRSIDFSQRKIPLMIANTETLGKEILAALQASNTNS